MVFNTTFNNISVISWWSVLLVEETGGPRENHRPVASDWETLSHNVVHLDLTTSVVIGTDCIGSCKSNYHMITAKTALPFYVNEVLLSFLPVLKDLKFVVCMVSVEDYQPHRQCKYYCAVDWVQDPIGSIQRR